MGKTWVMRAFAIVLAMAGLFAAIEPAAARHRYSFVPGHHGAGRSFAGGGHRRHSYGGHRRGGAATASRSRGTDTGADEGGAVAPPPPGSGFKMEDGVLTYPAPARFQHLKPLGDKP